MKNTYNDWTFIKELPQRGYRKYWLCRCKCGLEKSVQKGDVISGKSKRCKSCGATTHGKWNTPEYNSWHSMVSRCTNPKDPAYKNYGGRGIKVCGRWMDIANFIEDMGKRPSLEYSLDRINNNGNYEKSNCRWATDKEQSNNRRSADRRGDKCPTAKLCRERVLKMRALSQNYNQYELAKMFLVSPSNVNMILKNKTWKNI